MFEPAVVSIAAVPCLVESAVHVVGVEAGLAIPTGPRSEVPVSNIVSISIQYTNIASECKGPMS